MTHALEPGGTNVLISISRKMGIMHLTGIAKCTCGAEYRQKAAYSYPRQHDSTTVRQLRGNLRTVVRSTLQKEHIARENATEKLRNGMGAWRHDPNAPIADSNHLSGSAVDINAIAFPVMSQSRNGLLGVFKSEGM